jgi:hypothetical protein
LTTYYGLAQVTHQRDGLLYGVGQRSDLGQSDSLHSGIDEFSLLLDETPSPLPTASPGSK